MRYGRWVLVGVATALAVLVPRGWSPSSLSLAATATVWALVAVSLVVLSGWNGTISLGQFGIVGVGAIAAGNVIQRWNIDIFVTLLIAGAAGAVAAMIIGLPALRIRGLFLAVTTLAFAVALDSFFLNPVNFPDFVPDDVNPPILWDRFDAAEQLVLYYLGLGVLVVGILLTLALKRTRWGRILQAVKENEKTAQAQAIPTTMVKLAAFCYSGFLAGMAGGVYVLVIRGARVSSFTPSMSLEVFAMTVIGGLGSILGALLGVLAFRYLETVLSGELRLAVSGVGLLIVLYVLPGGLSQLVYQVRDRVLRAFARRRSLHVPSLVEDSLQAEPIDDSIAPDPKEADATAAQPVLETR